MADYGFLSVLEEELDKYLDFDFAMDWQKKNHALEVTFILEAQNRSGVQTVDDKGEVSVEDILFEDYVLFYNPNKSKFDADDYLVTLPFDPKKGFSREFLAYFAKSLNQVATDGLSHLMDFLEDEDLQEFAIVWDEAAFQAGLTNLKETQFYPYPRY